MKSLLASLTRSTDDNYNADCDVCVILIDEDTKRLTAYLMSEVARLRMLLIKTMDCSLCHLHLPAPLKVAMVSFSAFEREFPARSNLAETNPEDFIRLETPDPQAVFDRLFAQDESGDIPCILVGDGEVYFESTPQHTSLVIESKGLSREQLEALTNTRPLSEC